VVKVRVLGGGLSPLLPFEPPPCNSMSPLIKYKVLFYAYFMPILYLRMGMGFAPTWLRQVSPPTLLHKITLTTALNPNP